jgi:DNA-binding response OmpR family regulator
MGTHTASHETSGAVFLVVDGDERTASTIRRTLRPLGDVVVAHSRADALASLASRRRWTGLIIDWHLPDGSGFDVLRVCRQRDEHVPALMITGDTSITKIANEAYALHAPTIFKPFGDALVMGFAREATARRVNRTTDPAQVVCDWQDQLGLTTAEVRIFLCSMTGTSRSDLAEVLQLADHTVKNQIRSLLAKTGDVSLDALVIRAKSEPPKKIDRTNRP